MVGWSDRWVDGFGPLLPLCRDCSGQDRAKFSIYQSVYDLNSCFGHYKNKTNKNKSNNTEAVKFTKCCLKT